jgi:hypothetical protein
MKAYGGVQFLTLVLERSKGQLHALAASFSLKERVPHWMRDWVGPRSSLDAVE